MKQFEFFIYEDREERTGQYIGMQKTEYVYAETMQEAEQKFDKQVWSKYPWAMGYWLLGEKK